MKSNLILRTMNRHEKKPKRGDGVQTKAYKEPARKKAGEGGKSKVAKPKPKPAPRLQIQDFGRRLGTRTSTAAKTADTIKIMKAREAESRRKRMKMNKQTKVERKMTQEEILEEAKLTEKMNLESLKKYEEMELEAKRRAHGRGVRTVSGPAIRYHSVVMPLIEEMKSDESPLSLPPFFSPSSPGFHWSPQPGQAAPCTVALQ